MLDSVLGTGCPADNNAVSYHEFARGEFVRLCFFRRSYRRERERPDTRQASLILPLASEVSSIRYILSMFSR